MTSERNSLSIGVIIASKGRGECLPFVLASLERQTLRPKHVVFSVTEDKDLPATMAALCTASGLNIKTVFSPPGLAKQRNFGLKDVQSELDIVTFIDDDFLMAEDWLEQAVKLFTENTDIVAASGTLVADGIRTGMLSWEDAKQNLDAAKPATPQTATQIIASTYGCNMLFRTKTMAEEKFDEKLPLYAWLEDLDFSLRIGRKGTIVRSAALRGVHLGVHGGRISGMRYGYSQIVNPYYIWRKGVLPFTALATHIFKPLVMNVLKSFAPEGHIDRLGRLKGNLRGLADIVLGKASPERILTL